MAILTYRELISIPDYHDRFEYLKLSGNIGEDTFGHDRYLNQSFYHSDRWIRFRNRIIVRDDGCDMAHDDYRIAKTIIIHHLNPITPEDILNCNPCLFDPDNVVCVSRMTHEAIHYGDSTLLPKTFVERIANDTIPWR